MVHDLTYYAIGLIYMTGFASAFAHTAGATATEKMKACPIEQYCHLALGVLYPLSTVA